MWLAVTLELFGSAVTLELFGLQSSKLCMHNMYGC